MGQQGQHNSKIWSKRPDTGSSLHLLPRANSKNPAVSIRISNSVDQSYPILWRCEPDCTRTHSGKTQKCRALHVFNTLLEYIHYLWEHAAIYVLGSFFIYLSITNGI